MLRYALALLALTAPAGASAQDPGSDPRVADARSRFERAEDHFRAGDFALALEGYEYARTQMTAAGHPNAVLVLYNVALSNERLGRVRVALEQFERFLVDAPADTPYRDDATRRAADLRRRLELARADSSGAGVSPVGPIIAAVGGAALIAGAILGGVALSERDAAQSGCDGARCAPDARAGIEDAHLLANVSDALLFGGLAIAAAGLVLTFVLTDSESAEATAACGPTGCAATVRGRF